MSAAIGAALAGARTITATSSQGLALMAEVVYIAASMRAPVVMAVGNRALSGPINIHCDHSDSMLVRDSGVDPALRRERAGGVRPDGDGAAPRRAPGRSPAGARLPGRLHDHALARSRSSCSTTTRSRDVRRRVPVPNPLLDVAPADDAGAVRDAGLLLRAAPPAGRRDARPRCASSTSSRQSSRSCPGAATTRSSRTRSTTPSMRSSASARPAAPSRTSSTSCGAKASRSACSRCGRSGRSPRRAARRAARACRSCRCSTAPTRPAARRRSSPSVAAARRRPRGRAAELRLRPRRPRHPSGGRSARSSTSARARYLGLRGAPCPV